MKPTCRHCGVELPPPHPGKGRQKQFCSDTCRVKFAYRRKLGVTTNRQRLERMLTTPYATPELEVGDAKWLAAMIDGEGFISLNCHERTRKGNTTAYFFPIVGV